jgi:hypothetical protein
MRDRHHMNLLRQVADIRKLQEQSAQGYAGAARATLQDKQQQLERYEAQTRSTEKSWRTAMMARSFDVAIGSLWASVLIDHAEQAKFAGAERDAATGDHEARMKECNIARVRWQQAEEAARAAKRRYAHRKEEAHLNDMADRAAGSWRCQ